jgi:hypothetical protein
VPLRYPTTDCVPSGAMCDCSSARLASVSVSAAMPALQWTLRMVTPANLMQLCGIS